MLRHLLFLVNFPLDFPHCQKSGLPSGITASHTPSAHLAPQAGTLSPTTPVIGEERERTGGVNRWSGAASPTRAGSLGSTPPAEGGSPAHPWDGASPSQGAKQVALCSWFVAPGTELPQEQTARSLRSRRLKMLEDWNDLHLISDPFLGLEARVGLNGSVCLRD